MLRGRLRQGVRPGRRRDPLPRLPARSRSCAAASTSGAACARSAATSSPLLAQRGRRSAVRRDGCRLASATTPPAPCGACARLARGPAAAGRAPAAVAGGARVIRSRIVALPRRAWLTLKYLGPGQVLMRLLTFPLRLTPLGRQPDRALTGPSGQGARLVSRARPAGDHRDPELRRPDGARSRRSSSIRRDDRRGMARDHRRRRRQRRRAPGRAARDRAGVEVISGSEQRRLRRERQPRPARERPRARRRRAELRRRGAAGLAGVPAVRRLRQRGRRRDRRRPSCCTPTGASSSAGTVPQPRRAGVVRPSLPLQAARTGGPARRRRPGAGGDRRVHVRQARGDRARSARFDERYAMAYEDVDWCLRAWQAGFRVAVLPAARSSSTTSR